MNKKTILIIILVLAIIVCASVILYGNQAKDVMPHKNEPTIYNNTIEGVGAFQTVNATNFTENETINGQTFYTSNWTCCEISTLTDGDRIEITKNEAIKVNDSPKGHTIYKNTATIGDKKGEVRYISFIKDQDNNRWIMINSPDKNLTDLMVDSFKVLDPVKKVDDNSQSTTQSTTQSSSDNGKVMVKREDGPGYMEMDRDKAYYSNGEWWADKS
jgi:hypothetical protein